MKADHRKRSDDDQAELAELFERYAETRAREVRNELVERHRWLATAAAKRFMHRGEPFDDLEQVALLGVLKAVERFDARRGTSFRSFAMPTITGELRRHFRDTTWALHVNRGAKELYLRLNTAIETLSHRLQRPPELWELARELGVSVETALIALDAGQAYRTAPLTVGSQQDQGEVESRALLDEDLGLTGAADRVALCKALAALPPKHQEIVVLRYFGDLTQTEIGERLGLSQVHVSRVLRAALHTLRENHHPNQTPPPATPHRRAEPSTDRSERHPALETERSAP